jgi:hypothetical protein
MSGGGGRIIIRRAVRAVAELESVLDATAAPRRPRLLQILGKDEQDWTDSEFNFLLRCIADAQDECGN